MKIRKLAIPLACSALMLVSNASAQTGSWSEMTPLPSPVSGHFSGVTNGSLLTAGGANFPISLFEGSTKEWVPYINALLNAATAVPDATPKAPFVRDQDAVVE